MKASPMTEKAKFSNRKGGKGKPSFNFNFGGIAEEEKQSEESSTKPRVEVDEADNVSFDLNMEEINVQ
jgi:hypothetical protein